MKGGPHKDDSELEMIFGPPKIIELTQNHPPADWHEMERETLVSIDRPSDRVEPLFGPLVTIDAGVWLQMMEHALETTSLEIGGVLFGQVWRETLGDRQAARENVWIRSLVKARHQRSTSCSLEFTHETWEAIAAERKSLDPSWIMIGWYHTHPNWGIFLSTMDLFICKSFFSNSYSVAVVIDPCRQQFGCFSWDRNKQEMVELPSMYLSAQRDSMQRDSMQRDSMQQVRQWIRGSQREPRRWGTSW